MSNNIPQVATEEYLLIEINNSRKAICCTDLPREQKDAHRQYLDAVASGIPKDKAKEMYTIFIIVDHPFQRDFPHEGWQSFLKHVQHHRDRLQSDPAYKQQWEKECAAFEKFMPD